MTQYSLFFSPYCYFCQKVFTVVNATSLDIELFDVSDRTNQQVLVSGGGKGQVPCLFIKSDEQTRWLYESDDIIEFLQQQSS